MHRLTQRAQLFRRITDGLRGMTDLATGRDAGEEDCIQRASTMSGTDIELQEEIGYLEKYASGRS